MTSLLRTLLFLTGLPGLAIPALAQGTTSAELKKSYIHTLQLADRIHVSVYGEDDLRATARINARGRVNLPLVGEVAIGGMTLIEAQAAIENSYKDGRFLRNPQATVSVEEYAAREVSLQGAVKNPGRYALPAESTLTIVELVTKAGGFTDIAKGTAVSVTRILPDGTKKIMVVDVESIIKGKKSAKTEDNILLHPGDIVYVPESLI